MRSSLITVIGIVAICIGGVGFLLIAPQLAGFTLAGATPDDRLFFADRVVALATKISLIVTGILLIRRSRLALPALVVTLVLSLVDSLAVNAWFLPAIPAGLSAAGRAGRIFGRAAASWLPAGLYFLALWYLTRPKIWAKFPSREQPMA
jgi:hypothetical protein